MKIAAIEATTHRIPIQVPLLAEPITPQIVFTRVTTDTGLTGFGLTGGMQRFATRELINLSTSPSPTAVAGLTTTCT